MSQGRAAFIGYVLVLGWIFGSLAMGNSQPFDNVVNAISQLSPLLGIERNDDGTIQQGIDCNGPCG